MLEGFGIKKLVINSITWGQTKALRMGQETRPVEDFSRWLAHSSRLSPLVKQNWHISAGMVTVVIMGFIIRP